MDSLTVKEKIELWRHLVDEEGWEGYAKRITQVVPSYLPPYHLKPLLEAFHKIRMGKSVKLLLSVPPRHAKTESILFCPSYLWEKRDPLEIVYASASTEFAREKSRIAQQYAIDTGFKIEGNLDCWYVGRKQSFRVVGTGKQLTGHGADLLIIDDPIKDREEAESALMRDKTYDWFTSAALTRVEPGGSIIVVHTRWHSDDLIGRLEDMPGWDIVNLPALSVQEGELKALWPDRWSVDALLDKKRGVGMYDWASMYMGNPRPKGATLFADPARYDLPDYNNSYIMAACDPAATANQRSDNSCIVVGAFKKHPDNRITCDIVDVWAGKLEIPNLSRKIADVSAKWGCPVAIEAVGGLKAVPQMVRKIAPDVRVKEITPKGDKYTRAQPAAAAWNRGDIRIPADTQAYPWVRPFVGELNRFTGVSDPKDDQVDALVHLWNTGQAQLSSIERKVIKGRVGTFA